eukprot:TRINITY_DN13580_c0_g1_i3.p1 TRINITY_DN13580_c0_g1~~TRINITY_DN13580_c0_g1_i3.p1  ORF type:complete len:398 (-),score=92.72 TRINITY_DN13580_c0_g1_i3:148-1341(-)
MQRKIAPLLCVRCALCLESGVPAEVQWAIDMLGRLSAKEELVLSCAPGLAEAVVGVITNSWSTDNTGCTIRVENRSDVLHDAVRSQHPWGNSIEPGLGLDHYSGFQHSLEAWSILRNLSFTASNGAELCNALCMPLSKFGEIALLQSMLKSVDEEMQNDAVQILCNIAGSLPGDAVWACAALEAEVLKHSSDCTTASAVHLGPVVSALCVVATRHEALFARWGAQASGDLFQTVSTLWVAAEGSDNEQLPVIFLELVFFLSKLPAAVRRSLASAPECISQLVKAVQGDPSVSTRPQCAAATLVNLVQSKEVCLKVPMHQWEELLEVAASSRHAEITSRVMNIIELVYGSHHVDKQAEERKKREASRGIDHFKERLLSTPAKEPQPPADLHKSSSLVR